MICPHCHKETSDKSQIIYPVFINDELVEVVDVHKVIATRDGKKVYKAWDKQAKKSTSLTPVVYVDVRSY